MIVRMLLLLAWLAIAFVLPPTLGHEAAGPDGGAKAPVAAKVSMPNVPFGHR